MNSDFEKLFEEYMLLDKKTLAELLALRELRERNGFNTPQPYVLPPYVPQWPENPYPSNPYPTWPWVWYSTTNGKSPDNVDTTATNIS